MRTRGIIAAAVALAVPGWTLGAHDMHFGLYYSDGKSACISFKDGESLREGDAVTIVQIEPGAETSSTVTLGSRNDQCEQFLNEQLEGTPPARFSVEPLKIESKPDMAIAVLGATNFTVTRNKTSRSPVTGEKIPPAYVRAIAASGKPMSFNFCFMPSTVVLTAWEGDPDTGKRLWIGSHSVTDSMPDTCRLTLPKGILPPEDWNDSKPIYP